MNELAPELTRQVLHRAMHQKLLLRATEVRHGMDARDRRPGRRRSEGPVHSAAGHQVVRRGRGGSGLYELWALGVNLEAQQVVDIRAL